VLLARSLAALDQVSRGRLVAGLGLGWSMDEFEAVGTPMVRRGQRLDEMLDVMPWPMSAVKDTSRGGKYHNKREFVALAGELAWPGRMGSGRIR
jgi:alkanesulfonate monooxygenase SsuD/methylene tetrahydromethanopterin reductase-like flavin-dependent oxidoreductase (luciferase family)